MVKKIALSFFALFLAFRSIELVRSINKLDAGHYPWYILVMLAFGLNLFITGVFAFSGFAFPTSRLLPDGYYRIRFPKTLSWIHGILGVRYFRIALMAAYWGKDQHRKRYFNGTRSGLEQFEFQTRRSEFGHLGALIAVQVASIQVFMTGHTGLAVLATVLNVISNGYPIILQRYLRSRLSRLPDQDR